MQPPLATIAARLQPAPTATSGHARDPDVAEDGGEDQQRSRRRRSAGAAVAEPARRAASVNIDDLDERARPGPAGPSASRRSPRRSSRPPSEVAGDDPDRDRVEDEHRRLRTPSGRSARIPSSWTDVVGEVARRRTGRRSPRPSSRRASGGGRRALELGRPSGVARRRPNRSRASSIRSYSSPRRQRPVALEDRRAGPGRSRSGRTARARACAGQDPLDLAQPVRDHLGDVGEHLGRPPPGLGRSRRSARPAATARRPRPPGRVAASRAAAVVRAVASRVVVVMAGSVARAA